MRFNPTEADEILECFVENAAAGFGLSLRLGLLA